MAEGGKARRRFRLVHLLLIVPYIAVLWVPYFNRAEPSWAGVPFFYWYQMIWIVLGAALLWPVYWIEERASKKASTNDGAPK